MRPSARTCTTGVNAGALAMRFTASGALQVRPASSEGGAGWRERARLHDGARGFPGAPAVTAAREHRLPVAIARVAVPHRVDEGGIEWIGGQRVLVVVVQAEVVDQRQRRAPSAAAIARA